MKEKTIWVLFSVANEYNQPENNLEAWWFQKPTEEQLMAHVSTKSKARDLFAGHIVRNYATYRLRELYEGVID